MMQFDEIRRLNNKRLSQYCQEQNERYKAEDDISDDRYCYELIRRAIFRIDDADIYFFEIYRPWVSNKIAVRCQREPELVADLTQEALLRFFKYVTPDTWNRFTGLPQLLAYLGKCGETSLLNHWRKVANRQKVEDAFTETEQLPASAHSERPTEGKVSEEHFTRLIWRCVQRNCKDLNDLFLAKQLWVYGMKPRELSRRHADRFPELTDIYKRKRNLLDRIKRDTDCEALASFA
jgi:DNA-directed RNA polymerase specialized sigma24 family protein